MVCYAGHIGIMAEPEADVTASPVTSSLPLSPSTPGDADPVAQRLAVLQKRLDIEMKV